MPISSNIIRDPRAYVTSTALEDYAFAQDQEQQEQQRRILDRRQREEEEYMRLRRQMLEPDSSMGIVQAGKQCRRCGAVKDKSQFYHYRRNADGLSCYCRKCTAFINLEYRKRKANRQSPSQHT